MQVWPILAVADVCRSAAWYEQLLAGVQSAPANADFDQVLDANGELVLCLHRWVAPGAQPGHLSALSDPRRCPVGHGLLLWFIVDDFDETWRRAQGLAAPVIESPSLHSGTGLRAFVVCDPDGYHVAVNEGAAQRG